MAADETRFPQRTGRQSDVARRATVRFLTASEGGRVTPPVDGMRPQLDVGEFHTSCIVRLFEEGSAATAGVEVLVIIEPMFPEQLPAEFLELRTVRLFEGDRLIAVGSMES